ncbi:MAG: bifunctional oligoribonuclease/PAP phosphatase NrnA [Gemmatimonadota bacterium]
MKPEARRAELEAVWAALQRAGRIVLTTHVNADGDGAGCEVAVAARLRRDGREPVIVNPTPFPSTYAFLLEDLPAYAARDREGKAALRDADLFLVLDTSEAGRLGGVAGRFEGRPVAVLDHHPPNPDPLGDPAVLDPDACATGELVYELLELAGGELQPAEARALYVAIATDTGSFRFSNTSARAHEMVAELLRAGADPAEMYRRIYRRLTPARVSLLQRALASLQVDPELPIAWVSLSRVEVEQAGAASEDMEGIVEYPRRLEGIEVAVLFRELAGRRTKASLRSNGEVDVAEVARILGGGGHAKAAGVLLQRPLEEGRAAVLEQLRSAMRG